MTIKNILTIVKTKSTVALSEERPSVKEPATMKNDSLEKDFFAASRTITQEKMDAKKGQVTESQVQTAAYLRRLHNAPDAHSLEQFGRRYKG
jgi:hypothetical protein